MRTFNKNLDAYHALNSQNDTYSQYIFRRLGEASTQEQRKAIMQEGLEHFAGQRKLYKELGEEMVKIMKKK